MLARLFRAADPRDGYDPAWGIWPGDTGQVWAGQAVTQSSSMQLLAVYGCVRLISDAIATLPVKTYRELADGTQVPFPKPAWLERPTIDLSFVDWCTQVLSSLLLHGNAYLWVSRNDRGAIVELVPLNPTVMSVRREAGRKVFTYNGQVVTAEIEHLKGIMLPGSDVGLSPIEAARSSISLGLSALQYGARGFESDNNMPGVIESPKPMIPGQMKQIAELWQRKRSKGGRGLPGVLDDGATWRPTGVTNEQAQFLQTRQFTAAEIAGQMFLVDPSELGIPVNGTSLTYINGQERSTRLVKTSYLPWMVRVEMAVSDLLFNPRYMKFNADGLLRGDSSQRWANYQIASQVNATAATIGQPPVMTTQEMRDYEDLGPAPAPVTPVEVPLADA